jgi:hypothetical protein
MKKYEISIIIATAYLLFYVLLFQTETPFWFLGVLFSLSPIPVLYMVYQILRNATYSGKDLEKGEEYGYQDVDKNTLGFF